MIRPDLIASSVLTVERRFTLDVATHFLCVGSVIQADSLFA